jgi:hypothetical protein
VAHSITTRAAFAEPVAVPVLRHLLANAARMTLLWLAFGILVGTGTTPPSEGWIGSIAGALAGIIVLAPVGMVLGLCGARRTESMAGGAGGLCLGALAGLVVSGEAGPLAWTGLIFGGLLGATFVAVFYRLPRLLLSRLTAQA